MPSDFESESSYSNKKEAFTLGFLTWSNLKNDGPFLKIITRMHYDRPFLTNFQSDNNDSFLSL